MFRYSSAIIHCEQSCYKYVFEFFGKNKNKTIISFNHHNSCDVDADGFHKKYLENLDYNVLYCKSDRNDWYQGLSLEMFSEILESLGILGDEITLYGSSMGGYAALYFSQVIENSKVISISPQYSCDKNVVPSEKRWSAEWTNLRKNHINLNQRPNEVWVIYDGKNVGDNEHAELILTAFPNAKLLDFCYSGHPTGYALNRAGLLVPLLNDIFSNPNSRDVMKYVSDWNSNYENDDLSKCNALTFLAKENPEAFINQLKSCDGERFLRNLPSQNAFDIARQWDSLGEEKLSDLFFRLAVKECSNPHILAFVSDIFKKRKFFEEARELIYRATTIEPGNDVFEAIKKNIEHSINSKLDQSSSFCVACMQKNEGDLIFTWALYWGQVAGFDNILILDNGSDELYTVYVLGILEALGVKIDRSYNNKQHFEKKGQCLLESLKREFSGEKFAVLVDCDEFYYQIRDTVVSFNPDSVRMEIERTIVDMDKNGIVRIEQGMLNIPKSTNGYNWNPKRVILPLSFNYYLDVGLHLYDWSGEGDLHKDTCKYKSSKSIGVMHFHNCEFNTLVAKAREKLANRVKSFNKHDLINYQGAGSHLVNYLMIDEKEYLKGFNDCQGIRNLYDAWVDTKLEFPFSI